MLNVIKIVFQLDRCLGHTCNISIIDLRPACEAWFDKQARTIKRNLFLKCDHQLRLLRTWTNQAHLTTEDIPKLRQLIETRPAQKSAYTCDTRVILQGRVRLSV